MFQLKECIFWTNVAHRISTFWTFYCLSELVQTPHVVFENKGQFLYKICVMGRTPGRTS